MAKCILPLYQPLESKILLELDKELQTQMAKCRQDFWDHSDRFLDSIAQTGHLDHRLWRNVCEEDQHILDAVFWEQLVAEEGELTEESALAEKLRENNVLIKNQEQQLQKLQKTIQEGRRLSSLLCQLLQGLLAHRGPDETQNQVFWQQLTEGNRLAEHLLSKLSPENQTTEQEGNKQEPTSTRLITMLREWTENAAPRHSLDGLHLTYSSLPDVSDSYWPYRSSAILAWEGEGVSPAQPVAENHPNFEEEDNDNDNQDNSPSYPMRSSRELPEGEEDEIHQDSLDEGHLTPSIDHNLSDDHRHYGHISLSPVEHENLVEDGEENKITDLDKDKQEIISTRLITVLREWTENAAPRHSLDRLHLTYSSLPDVSISYCPYRSSAILAWEGEGVSSAHPGVENHPYSEEENDKDSPDPSWELSEGEEDDVSEDSLAECYLTPSVGYDLSDKLYEYVSFSPAEQEVSTQGVEELGLDTPIGMKSHPRLGADTLGGLADDKAECKVTDHTNVASVLKPKIIKKKLPFCKCKIACCFPGL
ncbi:neuroblastoma breakpoint family member 9-like isoform X2 [Erinaceus europaeus]|uniref:Neuroblastoma breakpoint family member 9-like isoform X2 n=1 Tax=Erinaceus europaeus TaxID=9365 RepID=A0ABM3Y799_ERIEU|nr:neuroblastoma breakpoint family member 9-like isoform X2 [Erinaceus europaeus]